MGGAPMRTIRVDLKAQVLPTARKHEVSTMPTNNCQLITADEPVSNTWLPTPDETPNRRHNGEWVGYLPDGQRMLRVLVAEDCKDTADSLAILLKLWGHDASVVYEGRSDVWVFAPEMPYERQGDVNGVVFPCGWILDPRSGAIRIYYGGADSCLALATAQLSDVLTYLGTCPAPPTRKRAGMSFLD
jgi:beta-1,4-mannooligosaccharide phosphorylase